MAGVDLDADGDLDVVATDETADLGLVREPFRPIGSAIWWTAETRI